MRNNLKIRAQYNVKEFLPGGPGVFDTIVSREETNLITLHKIWVGNSALHGTGGVNLSKISAIQNADQTHGRDRDARGI